MKWYCIHYINTLLSIQSNLSIVIKQKLKVKIEVWSSAKNISSEGNTICAFFTSSLRLLLIFMIIYVSGCQVSHAWHHLCLYAPVSGCGGADSSVAGLTQTKCVTGSAGLSTEISWIFSGSESTGSGCSGSISWLRLNYQVMRGWNGCFHSASISL